MERPVTANSNGRADALVRNNRARSSGVALIADIPVELVAASDAHRTTLERFTSGWLRSDEQRPRLTFRFEPDPPPVPDRQPDRTTNGLDLWWDATRLWARDELGLVGTSTTSAVLVGGAPDASKSLDRVSAFLLSWALTGHDRHTLHAAAVLAPAAGAVVCLGGTGVGKSTLVAFALAHGWDVLSDDLLTIRTTEFGVEIAGVRRTLAIPPEAAEGLVGPLHALRDDGGRARLALHASRLAAGFHPVAGVVLVAHGTDPETHVVACPERAAFEAILSGRVLASTPHVVRRWLPVAAALSRLPTYHWRHGTEADTRRTSGRARLDELARLLSASDR